MSLTNQVGRHLKMWTNSMSNINHKNPKFLLRNNNFFLKYKPINNKFYKFYGLNLMIN